MAKISKYLLIVSLLIINFLNSLAMGETLTDSLRSCDPNITQGLITAVNVNQIDNNDHMTPLGIALNCKSTVLVQKLLDAKADPNLYSADISPLYLAIFSGKKMVDLLMKYGATYQSILNMQKSPLASAAQANDIELVKFFVASGFSVNDKDISTTALIAATQNNNLDIVKYLVESGAEINATDIYGRTALMYASHFIDSKIDTTIADYLLKHGADPTIKDKYNNDALTSVFGDIELMQDYINKGADVHQLISGKYTLLAWAAMMTSPNEVKLFLDKGLSAQELDSAGHNLIQLTLMHNPSAINTLENIRLLESIGVHFPDLSKQFHEDVGDSGFFQYFNKQGGTDEEFLEFTNYILNKTKDVDTRKSILKMALRNAVRNNNTTLFKKLESIGADPDPQSSLPPSVDFLWIASQYPKNEEVIGDLLDRGLDIKNGKYLVSEYQTKDMDQFNYLVSRGADINDPYLLNTVLSSLDEDMLNFLMSKGVNVNQVYGDQPVLFNFVSMRYDTSAEKHKQVEMVNILLSNGAGISYQNARGTHYNLLWNATRSNNYELINELIVNYHLRLDKTDDIDLKPQPISSIIYSYDVLKLMTSVGGVIPNYNDEIDRTLKSNNDPLVIRNVVHSYNDTTLADAATKYYNLEFLLEKGFLPNIPNHSGKLATVQAAQSHCVQTMQLLVKHGADLTLSEAGGLTPLQAAINSNDGVMINYINSILGK